MSNQMDVYQKSEFFIVFLVILGAGITLGCCGFWVFIWYCFMIWLGYLGVKKFEKWLDGTMDFGYSHPRDNQENWDRFFGRGKDNDYNPNAYYTKQVEEAYKAGCDEDPDVIRIRKEIKSLVKANRLQAQREMEEEDIESGYNSRWGR